MAKANRLAREPEERQKTFFQERVQGDPGAFDAYKTLASSGCQPGRLNVILKEVIQVLENPGSRGASYWRGYGRDFAQRLADLRATAGIVATINSSRLGAVFMESCHPTQRECLKAIPDLLRGYADWLERSWKNLPKQLGKSLFIAALMQHIHRVTGKWHDRELSVLLGIAGDRFMCTEASLRGRRKDWRENPGLWEEAGALEQILTR